MNNSSLFLLPIIKVEGNIVTKDFYNSYIASSTNPEVGKAIIVVYTNEDQELDKKLQTATNFANKRVDNGKIVYEFTVNQEEYNGVVKPFINGAYSKIDRSYVESNFPRNPTHPLFSNRLILDKDPAMLNYWAEKGVIIPSHQEVWSIPDITKETYNYELVRQHARENS